VVAARREALDRLRSRGVEPFALRFDKDADAAAVRAEFVDMLEAGGESAVTKTLAGRIVLQRRHGKLAFLELRDRSGDIQLFCSKDAMDADSWTLLDDLDLGDSVGATGDVVKTTRGELSLKVRRPVLLAEQLRPLPQK